MQLVQTIFFIFSFLSYNPVMDCLRGYGCI
nr:MAG TPA: hypothetical protein [Caudoviricetes sp.]